jgi:hypothetical protein
MKLRRLAAISAVALVAATGLSACGDEHAVSEGATEGVYVTTGGLAYQVQISRQLNPSDFEDQGYLVGLGPAERALAPGQEWFAVFLRAFNRGDEPKPAAKRFFIKDTTGKTYEQTPVPTRINIEAFRSYVLNPGDQLPVPGSAARENGAQGGVLLFKVPVQAYDNRPLVLHIEAPEGGEEATVDLDV